MARREWALAVDRIACDGYGMCAELLPEKISLDDWGYPIIAPGAIPEHILDHAQRAVDVCPVLALRLQPMAATPDRARAYPPGGWNGSPQREPVVSGDRGRGRS